MTNKQIRIIIAEACGAKWLQMIGGKALMFFPFNYEDLERTRVFEDPLQQIPNYPNDLNACHEMEKVLKSDEQREKYYRLLLKPASDFDDDYGVLNNIDYAWSIINATALERCTAFIKTICPEKWID